jgi:hypothetical protein
MAEATLGDFLQERAVELERRLSERDLDREAIAGSLPEDPRARVMALATVLGLDALEALREDLTVDELEEARRWRREATKESETQMKDAGAVPPELPEEG